MRLRRVSETVTQAEHTAAAAREKQNAIVVGKIAPLKQALAREAELSGKHAEYEAAVNRLAELEKLMPEYTTAKDRLAAAQAELERLDHEHKTTRTQIEQSIAAAGKKIELLNDSGCPNIEEATCKFLADAIAAKKELPGILGRLGDIEAEYLGARQTVLDALCTAQTEPHQELTTVSEAGTWQGFQENEVLGFRRLPHHWRPLTHRANVLSLFLFAA